jgi:hypothetical protein
MTDDGTPVEAIRWKVGPMALVFLPRLSLLRLPVNVPRYERSIHISKYEMGV